MRVIRVFLILTLGSALAGCSGQRNEINPSGMEGESQITDTREELQISSSKEESQPLPEVLSNVVSPVGDTLETRIMPPEGYQRIVAKEGGFLAYMRELEMKAHESPVLLFDGRQKGNQRAHIAVFSLDLDNRDLQQCADSIMRIYAEYYWSKGEYEQIQFHLTNGFLLKYTDWQKGGRLVVNGNDISMKQGAAFDDSYENFRKYLIQVFAYAGTLSMEAESKPIDLEELSTGDMWIRGGSPGHCVMVADMAENEQGERCFLLAQGYMPAQDFHILKNNLHPEDPWYYISELSYPLSTPEYTFYEDNLKRWADFD